MHLEMQENESNPPAVLRSGSRFFLSRFTGTSRMGDLIYSERPPSNPQASDSVIPGVVAFLAWPDYSLEL